MEDDDTHTLLAVEANPTTMLSALRDALAGGPAVLPLDPRLPPRARGALVHQLQPGGSLKPGGVVSLPGARGVPADTLAVIPTSGSTGSPKGVVLSRGALTASVRAGLEQAGTDPAIPWLCCLPTSHVAGVLVLLRALLSGTDPLLVDDFDPVAIAALPGPFHMAVVPTMLQRLLDAGADLSGPGTVLVGGARVPDALRERVPGAIATYGMTETAGGCVYDGKPLAGTTVTAAADGTLHIEGPTLMTGYRLRGHPLHGLHGNGSFVTSDLGTVDPDGTVTVLGRADDVIISGGEKIVAAQVEGRLEQHPAVAEAHVIGVPDPDWGQRAIAVVVPAQVGAVLSLALLRSFVADEMPRWAAPQELVVVNTLPRLGSGKVDRVALRRSLTAGP